MARSVEERRKELTGKAARCEARETEYRGRVEKFRLKGRDDKARDALATAERAALSARSYRRALEELDAEERSMDRARKSQERTRAALDAQHERARPRPDRLQVYREALRHAAELEAEAERYRVKADGYGRVGDRDKQQRAQELVAQRLSYREGWLEAAESERTSAAEEGRDLARELETAKRAEERRERSDRTAAKRLEDLKLESNRGTAAGQREVEAGGKRGQRIASLASFSTLLRRPEDRTPERLEAMAYFEELVGMADAGLFPEPRFEHESGSGHGAGERVMAARAAGLQELADLEDAIGVGTVRLLRLRIVERQSFTAITRGGIGTETTVARIFLAAVDQLRVFVKTSNALKARLAAHSVLTGGEAA